MKKKTNGFTVCKHEKISLCPRFLGFNHSLQVMIHSQQQVGCHISSQYLDTTARTKEHTDLLPTPWSVYICVCHKWNQWLTWLILLCSDIRPSLQLFQLAWFCIDHFTWIHDSLNPCMLAEQCCSDDTFGLSRVPLRGCAQRTGVWRHCCVPQKVAYSSPFPSLESLILMLIVLFLHNPII